ncbi:MAG: hypothetical protein U5N55_10930 [Cypionkella sp.]|nr:hypothetical protein [Cypionkella sp.]
MGNGSIAQQSRGVIEGEKLSASLAPAFCAQHYFVYCQPTAA